MEMQIYCNNEFRPIEEALKIMTDDWVDDAQYCGQTVIDMRDVIIQLLKEKDL